MLRSVLISRLPTLNFTCYHKLSDSAVKLALKRTENKNPNSRKKTHANHSQNKVFSPMRFDALYRCESLIKNKWNSGAKPAYSDKNGKHQKTIKFVKNNPKWSSTEDESDYEDIARLEPPDWRKIPKIKITKRCYTPSKWTSERTNECIKRFCQENGINSGRKFPKPIFEFKELNLGMEFHQATHNLNLTHCTPIQSYAIPTILSGTSLVAIASDGSGKLTAAILSAAIHISHQDHTKGPGPIAVIMVSSGEMVDEIEQIANELCDSFKITIAKLKVSNKKYRSCDLMITTPEMLYGSLESGEINLYNCSFFSIYEADRIIGMGFEREMEEILTQIRQECVRMILSPIWNADIRDLAVIFLGDFTKLMVNSCEKSLTTMSPNVKQRVSVCEEIEKRNVFKDIIKLIGKGEKTVIFTETKTKANDVAENLKQEGFEAKNLVDASSKKDRENILKEFQNNESLQFIVVTNVILRHLKLFNTKNIINYDFPYLMSEYVNRANRTENRMISTVYSIFTEENGFLADELIAELRKTNQTIDPALLILLAANLDSDEELSFAVPDGNGFKKYTIDNTKN